MKAIRRRYLDTVKRIHDAMLHDPGDGTGRHVHGHGVGRQALVVVLIHDHGGEKVLARERGSAPSPRCRAIRLVSLSLFFPSFLPSLLLSLSFAVSRLADTRLRCRFDVHVR